MGRMFKRLRRLLLRRTPSKHSRATSHHRSTKHRIIHPIIYPTSNPPISYIHSTIISKHMNIPRRFHADSKKQNSSKMSSLKSSKMGRSNSREMFDRLRQAHKDAVLEENEKYEHLRDQSRNDKQRKMHQKVVPRRLEYKNGIFEKNQQKQTKNFHQQPTQQPLEEELQEQLQQEQEQQEVALPYHLQQIIQAQQQKQSEQQESLIQYPPSLLSFFLSPSSPNTSQKQQASPPTHPIKFTKSKSKIPSTSTSSNQIPNQTLPSRHPSRLRTTTQGVEGSEEVRENTGVQLHEMNYERRAMMLQRVLDGLRELQDIEGRLPHREMFE